MFKRIMGHNNGKNAVSSLVLVVSDDADTSSVVCETLTENGYEVHEVATVEDAVAILDTIQMPDLLIGDFANPEVDGKEFLKRAGLRLGKSGLPPVMFLMDHQNDETAAHELGAQELCHKPLDPVVFLQCVVHAIESRRSPINS